MNIVFNRIIDSQLTKFFVKTELKTLEPEKSLVICNNQNKFDYDDWFEEYYSFLIKNKNGFMINLISDKVYYVGHIGIKEQNPVNEAEIYIEIFKRYHGIKIGESSLNRFLNEYCIKHMNLRLINLKVIESNIIAINLYNKFKFAHNGISGKHWNGEKFENVIKMSKVLQ